MSDVRRWRAPSGMGPNSFRPPDGVVSEAESAEDAFRRLYETHYGDVLAFCRRRTDRASAQDATAEVFMVVWKKIDQRPDEHKALPWLYGIAYKTIGHQWRGRDRYRRLKRRVEAVAERHTPGPELEVVQQTEDRRVLRAMSRLSASDQEILRLSSWEELPHAQIATLLGISVSAADQRLHRARKRLVRSYSSLEEARDAGKGGAG